jgi:hypothetical protein
MHSAKVNSFAQQQHQQQQQNNITIVEPLY